MYNHLLPFSKFISDKLEKTFDITGVFFGFALGFIVITLAIGLLFLVFSVFYPRQVALQHPDSVALSLSLYGCATIKIFGPTATVVNFFTNIFLKLTRQKTGNYNKVFSQESVMSMIEVGQESGEIKEEGKKMISSIFDFDDKLAYEIMTPRTDVFMIDLDDETEEYIDNLMELRYSRIPVCREDSDNIIGILNIKDFLIKAREEGFENVHIENILREPYLVPETKNIDSLFFELQRKKQHIAVLIDEYGGFSGIVTMEDIIEEIMGDIDDEYDEEENPVEKVGKHEFILDGKMDLDDVNEELGTDLDSETSETVGGLIMDMMGEIPDETSDLENKNKDFLYGNYKFTVLEIKDRRIEKVRMEILPEKTEEKVENSDNERSTQ